MLNYLIKFSLKNRLIVLLVAILISVYGIYSATTLPVDVFPDLNRPVVTIFTEGKGLAPEEIESRITFPIESTVNGASGVYRVRSTSSVGLSLVFVEFDWNTDVYLARQIVNERLQQVSANLPKDTTPVLGPVSSIMGEIMLVGLTSKTGVSPMELRNVADWQIRQRLLSLSGISQVSVIGGERKQYQVEVDPLALQQYGLSLHDIEQSVANSNLNTTGGFIKDGYQESLVRNLGAIKNYKELESVAVNRNINGKNQSIPLSNLAEIKETGPLNKRGDAGINGNPAVILSIQKQPHVDTVELTKRVKDELLKIQKELPEGITVIDDIFQQSKFINSSVKNVEDALRDGAILVAIILILFLLNIRTTFITLTAIPLSLLTTFIVFKYLGIGINTMTLGGIAVAIGELVDDAIVDVENVFRRLRENKQLEKPREIFDVIFEASTEVRNSIVNATIIVVLVFIPLFAMSGIEGKIFAPLGYGYIISIVSSLVVSLTVTPVLCYYLLPRMKQMEHVKDSPLVIRLKSLHEKAINFVFRNTKIVFSSSIVLFVISLMIMLSFGKEFLPPFNEGSVTVNLLMPPGTSLLESNRIGAIGEKALLTIPEIKLVGRRTGRAELDEHAEGVHSSELDAEILESKRSKQIIVSEIRTKLSNIPGVIVNIGQPISHRIDHILSGVKAQIAIKVFGKDLTILRQKAEEVKNLISPVSGIVDVQVEKQVLIPQFSIKINRDKALLYGVNPGEIAEYIETALNGKAVTEIINQQQRYDVVVCLSEKNRISPDVIKNMPIDIGGGKLVALSLLADIQQGKGPNQIVRENANRRIVISANVANRDLVSTVTDLQKVLGEKLELSEGYYINYGGQFESQAKASSLILILGTISLVGVFLVLYFHFKKANLALQVLLAEIPFAFCGAVFGIWITGGVMSIATLVGFVTLTGIASRNGIMMIDHYLHLLRSENEKFDMKMIIRGSSERLVPVLMTALTAVLALVPILLSPHEPGREILFPVAVVIFSGLTTSTLLNLVITPLIFWKGSKKLYEKQILL